MDTKDFGLSTLLDMDGYQFRYDNGYWWKIEARRVEASIFRPHGIRYNLTLHNAHNHRIFGMDNAHGITPPRSGGFRSRMVIYDHVHTTAIDPGQVYCFQSATQLLNDFFAGVDSVMKDIEDSL